MDYIILRVNGCLEKMDKKPTLEDMQKIVGGYIEPIRMGRNTLWINENGIMQGLQTNKLASNLVNKIIVGDAIIEILTSNPDPNNPDIEK